MRQHSHQSRDSGTRARELVFLGAIFTVFASFSPCAAAEQPDPDSHPGRAPLFASHVPLAVTIEAPLTTLMRERPDEEYLEGTFSYVSDDGTETTLDLKLRTRGNFRRKEDICNFAPVRLNFRKKQVKESEFAGQDKLKLVTHCQQRQPKYENRVLREYLVYRIFQLLTDKSFSVRLFHINWVDTESGNARLKYNFVLEDDDDVAERNGMKSMKRGDVTHDDLDPRQENLVNVFQYMIGNTDFSLINGPADDDCCHNSKLLSATDGPPYMPLPYDFDFSGLVFAPYSAPNKRFKLASVRKRLFRGQCSNNELLPKTFNHFLEKKDAIYGLIYELDMVSSNTRGSLIKYLNAFYYDITQPERIDRKFIGKCNHGNKEDDTPSP